MLVTRMAMEIMEEQARKIGLPIDQVRTDRAVILMGAATEALNWIDAGAPGRAKQCLEAALQRCRELAR